MIDKLFMILESIIYGAFIIYELKGFNSAIVKYCGIIICLIYMGYCTYRVESRNNILRVIAIALTVIANYILLFTNSYDLALILFCLVQTIYAAIINNKSGNIYRYIMIGLFAMMLNVLGVFNLSLAFALYSLVNLYYNVIYSVKYGNKLFFIGLLLFLVCNICIVLYNMPSLFEVSASLQNICTKAGALIWIFYLPSQVLIMYSGDHYEKENN